MVVDGKSARGVAGVFGGARDPDKLSESSDRELEGDPFQEYESTSLKLTERVIVFVTSSIASWSECTTTHDDPQALFGLHTLTVDDDFSIDLGFMVAMGLNSGEGPGTGRGRKGDFKGTRGFDSNRLLISLTSSDTLTSIVSRRLFVDLNTSPMGQKMMKNMYV